MRIDLLSVNDKNGLDRVYMLLNSIKMTKQEETQIYYHLLIEDVDEAIKEYFSDLLSDDFKIQFTDCRQFEDKIKMPEDVTYYAKVNYYTMIRCLCPSYFTQIDKMLYLDTDIVFLQHGLEDLWNIDIEQYYVAGAQDIIITNYKPCQIELKNLKQPQKYINGGVLLFNYKLIRENGLDKQMAKWCLNWNVNQLQPFYLDQTLINYLCKNRIQYIDYKFNDFSLTTSTYIFSSQQHYLKQKYGYNNPINSINDAVILHFLGELKPWKNYNYEKAQKYYPYVLVSKKIWQHLCAVLKKGVENEGNLDNQK